MADIKINIYRSHGVWFGALFLDGSFDSCDELPCDGDADEATAIQTAEGMPLAFSGERRVCRVDDEGDL